MYILCWPYSWLGWPSWLNTQHNTTVLHVDISLARLACRIGHAGHAGHAIPSLFIIIPIIIYILMSIIRYKKYLYMEVQSLPWKYHRYLFTTIACQSFLFPLV